MKRYGVQLYLFQLIFLLPSVVAFRDESGVKSGVTLGLLYLPFSQICL